MNKLADVCNTVGVIVSYSFKEAMKKNGCTDAEQFMNEYWFQSIHISNGNKSACTLKLSDLYKICGSVEFFDTCTDKGPEDYLHGNFTDDELGMLLNVAEGLDVEYVLDSLPEDETQNEVEKVKTSVVSDEKINDDAVDVNATNKHGAVLEEVSRMFDEITSADTIRTQSEIINELNEETETALNELYKKMIGNAFCGKRETIATADELVDTEQIAEFLEKQGFTVQCNDRVVVKTTVKCEINEGYKESDLQKMAELPNAVNLAVIADCCKYCIKPAILKKVIADVIDALYRVTIKDTRIVMQKVETITDAYSELYAALISKGFSVTNYQCYFVIRW
jgi:histone H3/H4